MNQWLTERCENLLVFFKDNVDSIDGSFGVQGIKDGFDKQDIGPTIQKTADLFGIGSNQFVKRHISIGGIFDRG